MPRRASVKTRIVSIGDFQGVRIPKPLLEQAGLRDEVDLHAEPGRIVIAAVRPVRAGWAEAAAALHARGEDGIMETAAPPFDEEEWERR
jgi:antitoxin MazE